MQTVWKGAINFGLVNVPAKMFGAGKNIENIEAARRNKNTQENRGITCCLNGGLNNGIQGFSDS